MVGRESTVKRGFANYSHSGFGGRYFYNFGSAVLRYTSFNGALYVEMSKLAATHKLTERSCQSYVKRGTMPQLKSCR